MSTFTCLNKRTYTTGLNSHPQTEMWLLGLQTLGSDPEHCHLHLVMALAGAMEFVYHARILPLR